MTQSKAPPGRRLTGPRLLWPRARPASRTASWWLALPTPAQGGSKGTEQQMSKQVGQKVKAASRAASWPWAQPTPAYTVQQAGPVEMTAGRPQAEPAQQSHNHNQANNRTTCHLKL